MKDEMVYNIIPRLYDAQAIEMDKLFGFSTMLDPTILYPNIIMRDQQFDIVAIVPPNLANNQRIVFFKDASTWCDKIQQYEEIFEIPMGSYLHRCTVGKEFWEKCPLDSEKIGIALCDIDSWNNRKYLLSVEASIGKPGMGIKLQFFNSLQFFFFWLTNIPHYRLIICTFADSLQLAFTFERTPVPDSNINGNNLPLLF